MCVGGEGWFETQVREPLVRLSKETNCERFPKYHVASGKGYQPVLLFIFPSFCFFILLHAVTYIHQNVRSAPM